MWLGQGSPNGVNRVPPRDPRLPPPVPAPRNWMVWQSNEFRYPTPSQDEHYCLVALMVRDGDPSSDIYYDRIAKKAVQDALADISKPIFAQRNYFEAARKRISGSRITHLGYFNVSGSSRPEGSSLILRQPEKAELVALQDMLGPRGRSIRDVTADARVGLFNSDPSREDHEPDQDKKLQKLPMTLGIQNLGPGCVRRIYLGFELPHTETKSTTAAFILAEQVTSDGKLVGGVAVVALSGEVTSSE
ncbi:hypothetical protein FOBRF1_006640 [Fusarium oxysporum]